jgi:hypothetical protein
MWTVLQVRHDCSQAVARAAPTVDPVWLSGVRNAAALLLGDLQMEERKAPPPPLPLPFFGAWP